MLIASDPVALPSGRTPGEIVQLRHALLGDLLLGGIDEFGTLVYLTELRGWDGASGTTLQTEQKVMEHGAWRKPAHHPGRLIEADLLLRGDSFSVVARSLEAIDEALPLQTPVRLVVSNHGQERTADVLQAADMLSTQKGAHAKVSLSLFATDPRRYSVETVSASTRLPQTVGGIRAPFRAPFRIVADVSSGLISVTNQGGIEAPVVFTVYGPCPPFTLTHLGSGRVLRFHDTVPAGRHLVIDTANKTARLDGTAARYVTGSWFGYSRGVNEVAFAADSYNPDALLTSQHRHAHK